MALLPLLNHFDQLEEFAVKRNEAIHYSHRVPDFIRPARRKDDAYGRLSRAFHHVLALFVEACGDGVVLLEDDEQSGQGRLVVVTKFEVVP
jgi:hypothetical protein